MELGSIAFIPDGNRRYAQSIGISLVESYRLGTEKAREVMGWLVEYPQIKVGTFYTLSLENLARNKSELNVLFKIFEKELDSVKEGSTFSKGEIRLKFLGRLSSFPKRLQEKMKKAEQFTENYKKKAVNLAIGYNGQVEIVDAAKKLAVEYNSSKIDLSEINEENFSGYLYSSFPAPDLIIRTSGTQRLSGFLTYQSAYSELYFCKKYWPEFSEQDLSDAVNDYYERQRRFGK